MQPRFTPALVEGRSLFTELAAPVAFSSLSFALEEMICGVLSALETLGMKDELSISILAGSIQALFASFTCFGLKLLKFVLQILLSPLDFRQRTLTFIPVALEVLINLVLCWGLLL